jgi:hypothetical protein
MRDAPAVLAASMTLVWWAIRRPGSLPETSSSRSTPASAAPRVCGRE